MSFARVLGYVSLFFLMCNATILRLQYLTRHRLFVFFFCILKSSPQKHSWLHITVHAETMTDSGTLLRVVYEAACAVRCCRVNSSVRLILTAYDDARIKQHCRQGTCEDIGSSGVQSRELDRSLTDGDGLKPVFVLDFSKNILGRRGILPILDVARAAMTLRSLRLSENFLTNESVLLLCDALEGHPSLQELDLSENGISQPAGKRLMIFVWKTPALTQLHLHGTLINEGLRRRLHAMLSTRAKGGAGEDANDSRVPQQSAEGGYAPSPSTPYRAVLKPHPPPRRKQDEDNDVASELGQRSCDFTAVALVPPNHVHEHLVILYEILRTSDESGTNTKLTTVKSQALAILMTSSHEEATRCHHEGSPTNDSTSRQSPSFRVRSATGAVFFPTAVVDGLDFPAGSIGYEMFSPLMHHKSPARSQRAAGDVSPASGGNTPPTQPTLNGVFVASPFSVLQVLLALPREVQFSGVELLMRAAYANLSTAQTSSAECSTLGILRADHDAVALRDPKRAALNLLMSAAFGDPLPLFNEMLVLTPQLQPLSIHHHDEECPKPPALRESNAGINDSLMSVPGVFCDVTAHDDSASETGGYSRRDSHMQMPRIVRTSAESPNTAAASLKAATPLHPHRLSSAGASETSISAATVERRSSTRSQATREECSNRIVHSAPLEKLAQFLDMSIASEGIDSAPDESLKGFVLLRGALSSVLSTSNRQTSTDDHNSPLLVVG